MDGTLGSADIYVQGGILDGGGKVSGSVVVTAGAIAGGDFAGDALGTLTIHGKLVDSSMVDATLVAAGAGTASDIDLTLIRQ